MFNQITPILRIFDEAKAKQFYIDYLGFHIDWEHRFEPGMPLYMQISLDSIIVHLSEHHGDCTPGAAIRIEINGLQQFHQQLMEKGYPYLRPAIEDTPWNLQELQLTDPFGNRVILYEPAKKENK